MNYLLRFRNVLLVALPCVALLAAIICLLIVAQLPGGLPWLLRLAAAMQLGLALINLRLPHLLHWGDELKRLPLLMREVFHVHTWFISVTLAIFGIVTWRFALEMPVNLIGRWLAAGIGFFWALRTILQMSYYSNSHWRADPRRALVHITLVLAYGCWAALYLLTAFGWTNFK
jgi:hypothetical protein